MRTVILVLTFFLVATGCSQQPNAQTKTQSATEDPLCNPVPVRYFDIEKNVKSITEQIGGVDQAVAVQIDDELDVAIKVTNFNRFRMKAIRKEVAMKLKEAYSKSNIHVTSDKKLFKDLQELHDTPWPSKHEDACKQKKRIKKIEKQMGG